MARRSLRKYLSCLTAFIIGSSCSTQVQVIAPALSNPLPPPPPLILPNGRPNLIPLPTAQEIWKCEVVVIGGSLGGVAAAYHAMQAGTTTCLIELTPWLGGQISSQGVSAIDASRAMWAYQSFASSWRTFKQKIAQQTVTLPEWTGRAIVTVNDVNSCWVSRLCFVPKAGATAAQQHLENVLPKAPKSRWQTQTAFKGATFDDSGQEIVAIHAIQRIPKESNYMPMGRLSQELASWYAWSADDTFEKVPLRLEPPKGKRMIVIDATDTGEFVGWANLPHRLGSEAKTTTGEVNGAQKDNPQCTQAFTYPFVVAIHDDGGKGLAVLEQTLQQYPPFYASHEHEKIFEMEGFPFFEGRSFFNYRRIVSNTRNSPFYSVPVRGDMTMVNWNRGNDWSWMDPPLIYTAEQVKRSGQQQNWLGGISTIALRHGEDHALLFARWLLKTQSKPHLPLSYLMGDEAYMGTQSGLSLVPYIREGRRILGRAAYGDKAFLMREADVRNDQVGGRDFTPTTVAVTHYDVDIHGCRYRNGAPTGEAVTAPAAGFVVRPVQIPLESMIPQEINNLLIGGKSLAVSHIVNAVTRVHTSEWGVGAAAGTTSAWLAKRPDLTPADIVKQGHMTKLQEQMLSQNLRLTW
ncbi:FAD-dependent oxidoreductase [Leptolyngbyaceae cyanobacterium CCMR0082]|uniref:FAD-dependent oxidoreductase n=1 Tax=Adonisia turfae CCMR0082 TaxID=2304604 RepID=A0A6M0SD41_9CYAN|nr:FAD-dependent oxidoreductase [Adonisia turfae]NEZ66405.1 FAD-dependent oxidoreductase [Adonisia turfae CCMR0082]